jgi:hypothetical protein
MFDAERMARWRKAVAAKPGADLAGLIAKLRKAGYQVGGHDDYKKVPKGFDPEHPRAELLKMKGLTAGPGPIPKGLLHKAGLADWLVQHGKALAPIVTWLDKKEADAQLAQAHKMDAIGSNAGHCLWTGIVGKERAGHVVQRLMAADMFSGWGIRTYAAGQGGYNPIGYHTGTVWPHDTSLIAAGFKRYGYNDEANLLCGRIFEASQHFAEFRLPELFCGFDREHAHIPVPYPVACSPQAWAAASSFLFLTTMLGVRPHADRGEHDRLERLRHAAERHIGALRLLPDRGRARRAHAALEVGHGRRDRMTR